MPDASNRCSALLFAQENGQSSRPYCRHGHDTSSPCHGVALDSTAPNCMREDRQFLAGLIVVRGYPWLGGIGKDGGA